MDKQFWKESNVFTWKYGCIFLQGIKVPFIDNIINPDGTVHDVLVDWSKLPEFIYTNYMKERFPGYDPENPYAD